AQSIYDFFQNEEKLNLLNKLKQVGIELKKPKTLSFFTNQKSKGLLFVFTGSMSSLSRDSAKQKVIDGGGRVAESVSKDTSFLVVGKNPGSKFEKAQKLGIKIIEESDFIKMLKL
ncbi:MAG: BRCT domain-containing protein, partial [Patescibacteria group bacterium]